MENSAKSFEGIVDKIGSEFLQKSDDDFIENKKSSEIKYTWELAWKNIILLLFVHVLAVMGILHCFKCNYKTLLWAVFLYLLSGLGITAGTHRLYAHCTYKAHYLLEAFYFILNSIAGTEIYEWARDHRGHHKFSETDGDPHNSNRGFFFSHMGWLLIRKHPDVINKGKSIPYDDLDENRVLQFQKKNFLLIFLGLTIALPTLVPILFWKERIASAFFVAFALRFVFYLHITWFINSWLHWIGLRPYDARLVPSESILVSFFAVGEGFHNYHHAFPYDYSTSELGWQLNLTTLFLDAMQKIGLAWDLKTASPKIVEARREKFGDGSLDLFHPNIKWVKEKKEE